ncbi:MAG: YidC/Oxa1 family membrane protein insertase [Candidatus Altimarinota bacterium]
MAKKFFVWLLIFLGLSLILQSFQTGESDPASLDDFVLATTQESYTVGESPVLNVTNQLDRTIRVSSDCPSEPLTVERYQNGVWQTLSAPEGKYVECAPGAGSTDPTSSQHVFHQAEFLEFAPKVVTSIDYSPWKDLLFDELGRYRIQLAVEVDGTPKSFFAEFEMEERGFFSSVSFRLFLQPIFNFLLFLTSVLPGHNFGLAVIALTLIIRLILLVPNQKALKSQKAMSMIQPELEAIKRKYKGDQQRISMETMELWKKHRVNPIGGCLPLLIQLPILIALFYVVKTGFTPYQGYLMYDFLKVDLSQIDTNFFGILQLEQVNATWLPILVGLLQFFQMKLAFARKKIDKGHAEGEGVKKHEIAHKDEQVDPTDALQDPLRMMNKTMLYFMPLMMGFMVATLPSGVGLYLAVSTLFGIVQQYAVNRS